MSSRVALARCAVGIFAAGICFALGAGCLVATDDQDDPENIGVSVQALAGEGERCGTGFPACEENLTCCFKATVHRYYCRALQTDDNNCGACNLVCDVGDICMDGECQYFGE